MSDHVPGARGLDAADYERAWQFFRPFYDELGVPQLAPPQRMHPDFSQQVDALLEARPPVFSFVFGIPTAAVLTECRRRDIVTIGAATTPAEGQALSDAGVDMIVGTGAEAGGHRPSFLAPA